MWGSGAVGCERLMGCWHHCGRNGLARPLSWAWVQALVLLPKGSLACCYHGEASLLRQQHALVRLHEQHMPGLLGLVRGRCAD